MNKKDELFLKYYGNDFFEEIKQGLFKENMEKRGYIYIPNNDKTIFVLDSDSIVECSSPSGKKYKMLSYKDCDIQENWLVNNKLKKFRCITLADMIDFNKFNLFLYDGKEIVLFEENMLYFINKNNYLAYPGPLIADHISLFTGKEIRKKYFNQNKDDIYVNKIKSTQHVPFGNDFINAYIRIVYIKVMAKYLKNYDKEYADYCKKCFSNKELMKKHYDNEEICELYYCFPTFNNSFEFCEYFCSIDIVISEVNHYREVRQNIKNNFWINYSFENSLIDNEDNYIPGEDFTFLILNLIKAFEFLLYIKIKRNEIPINDNNKLIDDKVMLNEMIKIIKSNKEQLIKPDILKIIQNDQFDEYVTNLLFIKDECRNGYFHKDRLDNKKQTDCKREKLLEGIIETLILLK